MTAIVNGISVGSRLYFDKIAIIAKIIIPKISKLIITEFNFLFRLSSSSKLDSDSDFGFIIK